MNQNNKVSPDLLVAQLNDEEKIAEAFEGLVDLGDAAVPALEKALNNPKNDRDLIYSVLSSIETETSFGVLARRLFSSKDKEEQSTLALLLAKDGRTEINDWLEKQLPARWEDGSWWRKNTDTNSEFTATILAALICLELDPRYLAWFEESLESDDARLQAAAELIGELLNEYEIDEEDIQPE